MVWFDIDCIKGFDSVCWLVSYDQLLSVCWIGLVLAKVVSDLTGRLRGTPASLKMGEILLALGGWFVGHYKSFSCCFKEKKQEF